MKVLKTNTTNKPKNKKVTITVNEDVDLEFRKIASLKLNFSRKWYSTAVEEAMIEYIENHKQKQIMEVV